MAFEPDILITTPDGRVTVIEAKVAMKTTCRAPEEALKRHVLGMQYPFWLADYAGEGMGLSRSLLQPVARFRKASRGVR
jgi:hypothetical protein